MTQMPLCVALPMITAASRCGLLSGGTQEVEEGQEVVLGGGEPEVALDVIDETQFVTRTGGGDMSVRASLIRCLRTAVEEWWAEENASEGVRGGREGQFIQRRAGVVGSVGLDGSVTLFSDPVFGEGRGRVLADVMTV